MEEPENASPPPKPESLRVQASVGLVSLHYLINDVTVFRMDLCNGTKIPKDPERLIELQNRNQTR